MARKTKNNKLSMDGINTVISNAGMLLMMASATMLMLEVPDHPNQKALVPAQPVMVTAEHGGVNESLGENSQRREREEVGPHYISYGASQRTPGRSGRA